MFQVGQLVVCIRGIHFGGSRTDLAYGDEFGVVTGKIYTVRELDFLPNLPPGLRLEEVVNAPRDYADGVRELSFCASRFRPLNDTKLAIFRKMLAPAPRKEEVA